jgi:hypothetical protein
MKQKIYNYGLFAFMLLVLIAMGGCKKFLDRKPLGVATDGDLTVGGVQGKVFGLYGQLRDQGGMSDLAALFFKSVRSDDAQKGSTPGDIGELTDGMDHYQYTKDHWLLNSNWDGHYNFIYACNDVLHEIDSLNLTDPGSLINEAEAKFLRAYAYFDLVRDYGEVPLIDFKINEPGDANVAKKSVAEIYALIDADLQFAYGLLPLSWGSQYPGRITKGAVSTLQAKTMLYRKNWSGALAKSEEVINSGEYALLNNYSDYFKESGENSSESIFEIQMYENANGSVVYGNSYNQVQGIRGSGDWDLGWGFNVPTADLDASYETGDPRRGGTILYEGQPDGIYGRTIPTGLAQPMWNKKVYTDPARQAATGDRFSYWLNIRILRYADVLLMAAEAANELGGTPNTTKALQYLEVVRSRARGGNNSVLPPVTTTNQGLLRTAIKKERRAEFGMEWERFYDLVRWVPAADGIDAINILGPLGYLNKCRYYPIPQPALDRNPQLVQNPEW